MKIAEIVTNFVKDLKKERLMYLRFSLVSQKQKIRFKSIKNIKPLLIPKRTFKTKMANNKYKNLTVILNTSYQKNNIRDSNNK